MDGYGMCMSSGGCRQPPNTGVPPQYLQAMDHLPGQAQPPGWTPRVVTPVSRALRRARLHIRRPCVLPGTARDLGPQQETPLQQQCLALMNGSEGKHQATSEETGASFRSSKYITFGTKRFSPYTNKCEEDTHCELRPRQHPARPLYWNGMLEQNPSVTATTTEAPGSTCSQNPFRRELFRSLMPRQLSASSILAERTFFTVNTIGGKEDPPIHTTTGPGDRTDTISNDYIPNGNTKSRLDCEYQHTTICDTDHPIKGKNNDKIFLRNSDLSKHSGSQFSVNTNIVSLNISESNVVEDHLTDAEASDEVVEEYLISNCGTATHENDHSIMHRSSGSFNNSIEKERLISACDSGLGDEDLNYNTLSRMSSCFSVPEDTGEDEARNIDIQNKKDELLEQKPNGTQVSPVSPGSSCFQNPFRRELFRTLMPLQLSASSLIAERTFFTVDTIGGRDSQMSSELSDKSETFGNGYRPVENWEIITESNQQNSTMKSMPLLDFTTEIKNSRRINENKNISEVNLSSNANSIVEENINELVEITNVFKSGVDCKYQHANSLYDVDHLNKCNKGIVYTVKENKNNGKTYKYNDLTKPSEHEMSLDSELVSLNLSEPGIYDLVEDHLASICDSVSKERNRGSLSKEVSCLSSSFTDDDSSDEMVDDCLISVCDMEMYENNQSLSEVTMERLISSCDSGLGESDHDHSTRESSCPSTSNSTEGDIDVRNLELDIEGVLCGNRVSQMTKTYNDIEAVTRLLQEKEKDLELAAKIGQQLLSRSKVLEERNSSLESELASSGDVITQLKHDLQMKTDLLQIYTNDVDDSSCETTPTGLRFINVDILQNRVKNLEAENETLRDEASKLVDETDEVEDREENLVKDVIKQLGDANSHANQLSDELSKKVEDSLRQQEEITHLLAQVVDLQSRNKRMTHENEELHNMVGVARECQQELTTELAELKEKYAEVLDLLHDTQEQLRRVQKKNLPGSRGSHLSNSIYSSPFNSGNDSIATELHSLNSIGEELSNSHEAVQNHNLRRAFETVRLTGKYSSGSHGSLSSLGYGSSVISTPTRVPSVMGTPTHMTNSMSQSYNSNYLGSRGSSIYSGESGHPSLDSGADSDASMHTDSEDNYPASQAGVPGWPGTPDLNSCLRRLGPGERSMTPSHYLPYGCRTPDSIMSTDPKTHWPISPVISPGSTKSGGSSSSGFAGSGSDQWRLPQKLQIVKPIEGSLTLHQWSRLAKPHLGGLLEEREGVANKGGIGHNLNLEVYSMSDLEEDEEIIPGKQFMSTSGINTYTNSTILHPDDNTMITPSLSKTQVSVLPTCSGLTGTTPSTPLRQPSCPASRRGSTATFSTNVGLAKVLNERGMSQGHGWSPTATPANSPSGSRPGSPEPEGYKLPGLDDLTKTFQYGASLLRRTFYKEEVSSGPHSPVGPRVSLLETVQDIGVERLMRPQEMTLSVGGVVTSRPATSPLLHLSNLIMSSAAAKNTSTTISTTTSATTSVTFSGITSTTSVRAAGGLMFTPKLTSPGERRPSFPPGAPMGIPGHPGAGHLDTRLSQLKPGQRIDLGTVRLGQRSDLGTVGGRQRPTSLGSVPGRGRGADSNVGAVSWMAQGRKGGLY